MQYKRREESLAKVTDEIRTFYWWWLGARMQRPPIGVTSRLVKMAIDLWSTTLSNCITASKSSPATAAFRHFPSNKGNYSKLCLLLLPNICIHTYICTARWKTDFSWFWRLVLFYVHIAYPLWQIGSLNQSANTNNDVSRKINSNEVVVSNSHVPPTRADHGHVSRFQNRRQSFITRPQFDWQLAENQRLVIVS